MIACCGNCLYWDNFLNGNGKCLRKGTIENITKHCIFWKKNEVAGNGKKGK